MSSTFTVIAGDVVRSQALAVVELLDPTVAGGPGSAALTAIATDPHVRAHVVEGTLVFTGRPELALPHLDMTAATLHATVQPAGGLPQAISVDVPAATVLPLTAPPIRLEVAPIAVIGSVTAAAFPHAPIAGAEVAVGGGVVDGFLVAARTPLGLAHPTGTTLRGVVLTTAATTTTTAATAAGATTLRLGAAVGSGSGSVLALGPDETVEHVVVASIAGTDVTLRSPTVRTWPAGTDVARVTVAAGAATALVRPARAGDGVLVVAAANAALAVQVADADPDRVEYRSTGARAYADGRWRLAGVRGVPSLSLTASAGGFVTAGPAERRLDGRRDPNVLDIVLTA